MILPAVRERLETVLRHPSMDGAIAALRSGGQHVSLAGLHDVAKALVAAYIAHELRRPAFFVTDSNRRAEALADTVRFFSTIFPSALGGVATLPAFDTLPGRHLAQALATVRKHKPRQPLPRVSGLLPGKQLEVEEDNVKRSLAYAANDKRRLIPCKGTLKGREKEGGIATK